MRPGYALILLFSAALLWGCSSNNEGKIEGTRWSNVNTRIEGSRVPDGAIELDFYLNGHLVYTFAGQRYVGSYSLGLGDYVTLHFDRELEGRKDHRERIVIHGDRLRMTDSDGTSVEFRLASRE